MSRIHTRNRRVTTLLGAGLTAVLLFTACSGNPGSESSSTPAHTAESLPTAEGKTTYPLTLVSDYGETVLPERPTRIAAIAPNAIDTELLLALGTRPVLSSSMVNESASASYLAPYRAADIKTFEFVMGESLPVEAIAASKPDLIVTVGWSGGLGGIKLEDYYDRLASIAPVLTNRDTGTRFLVPWQESIRALGTTLDLSNAAEKVISDNDAFFATVREENPVIRGLTATWAIWYGAGNGLQYLSEPGSAPESFLTELGFTANPLAEEFTRERTVSDELLSKIDADVLLLGRSRAGDQADFDALVQGPLFQRLGAVSSGRWAVVPPVTEDGGDILWAVTSGGPIGNEWAVKQLLPLFISTL